MSEANRLNPGKRRRLAIKESDITSLRLRTLNEECEMAVFRHRLEVNDVCFNFGNIHIFDHTDFHE